MAIKITVGPQTGAESQQPVAEPEKPIHATQNLKLRKMLDGTLVVQDHEEIDIAINPLKNKIIALAKDEMGDHIYAAQSRLFDFLAKKGVIEPSSIQGGNIYSTLEATMLTPENQNIDLAQIAVFSVGKFIEEERPYYRRDKKLEDELQDRLLSPEGDGATELGDVPHQQKKGAIDKYPGSNAAYGMVGGYRG